jgi:DNA polymerase-3 subunit epsilon
MALKLNKPICFFDLETTGIQIATDRIVEISILKEQPIPDQATAIHGIDDAMVANEPNFKALAPKVAQMIKDSDLAGFNSNRFDIPLLAEELLRAEVDIDLRKHAAVDVQTIFHKMEKRTLTAAYKFYCGKELEQAHSAEADTQATYEVLLAQMERYPELGNDVASLAEFSAHKKFADFSGHIQYNEHGQEIFAFGKHKGTPVAQVLAQEPGYFGWLLNADFPRFTKKVLTQIKLRSLNTKSDS